MLERLSMVEVEMSTCSWHICIVLYQLGQKCTTVYATTYLIDLEDILYQQIPANLAFVQFILQILQI